MKKMILSWISALNKSIIDTEKEIQTRGEENYKKVNVKDDLIELVKYIDEHQLPDAVKRGIENCLKWNPHCQDATKLESAVGFSDWEQIW